MQSVKEDLNKIIEGAKNYERYSQTRLVEIFWAQVHCYVKLYLYDCAYSEDVTAKTFNKVLEKINSYDSKYSFRTWLYAVARNQAIDFYRDQKYRTLAYEEVSRHHQNENFPSPEQLFIEKQRIEEFQSILEQLPANYRRVFQMKYLDGKTAKEIAFETKLSISNVKVILFRATKILRKKLIHISG